MLAIFQGWLKGGNQQEKRPSKDLTFQVTINFYFKVRQFLTLNTRNVTTGEPIITD